MNLVITRIKEAQSISPTDRLAMTTFNQRSIREYNGSSNRLIFSRPGYVSIVVNDTKQYLDMVDNKNLFVEEMSIVIANTHPNFDQIISSFI